LVEEIGVPGENHRPAASQLTLVVSTVSLKVGNTNKSQLVLWLGPFLNLFSFCFVWLSYVNVPRSLKINNYYFFIVILSLICL
jgi:hypothetical protein